MKRGYPTKMIDMGLGRDLVTVVSTVTETGVLRGETRIDQTMTTAAICHEMTGNTAAGMIITTTDRYTHVAPEDPAHSSLGTRQANSGTRR